MNIEIANRLVQLRKKNGLSQEELAEKLGISRQAVSKWERAESSPDTDNLISIAKLYNVSLDELLQTDEDPEVLRARAREKEEDPDRRQKKSPLYKFPYPVAAVILFFLIGFLGNAFQYAWLIFLTVPLYYGIAAMLSRTKD
jgi:transcriptional regulator with XRE-family HTH domain